MVSTVADGIALSRQKVADLSRRIVDEVESPTARTIQTGGCICVVRAFCLGLPHMSMFRVIDSSDLFRKFMTSFRPSEKF